MSKYLVSGSVSTCLEREVEAESVEEARTKFIEDLYAEFPDADDVSVEDVTLDE